MSDTQPPVFHIPIGPRRENGEVVLFENEAEQASAMRTWCEVTQNHSATVAAGGCVIIGPTTTMYFDRRSHTVFQSDTAEGEWQPAALSDLDESA